MEDSFSTDWKQGGLGMIQAHMFIVYFISKLMLPIF